MSAKLKELLGSAFDDAGGSAFLLMSLPSGRILESGGDQHSRLPPGSLLKIPYAASLSKANSEVLAAELAASDTGKLLARREQFQAERYRLLLSPIKEQGLARQEKPMDEQGWRAYLGERDADGGFGLQAGLPELALAMRASVLSQPAYFQGLRQNGFTPGSTLFGQNEADKLILQQLHALSKTGTVSSASGQSIAGHLLVVWPVEHPVYLALFRQRGVKGASLLAKASALLRNWRQSYPPALASVYVRLLTPTPLSSWEAMADCPELLGPQSRFTTCGQFRIVSSATGSRSERVVEGVLRASGDKGPVVLETDVDSYVDAVLDAEAQTLTGSAREAFRAVIAWNAVHGGKRHPDTDACAIRRTAWCSRQIAWRKPPGKDRSQLELLHLLDKLAAEKGLNWLPFSKGGDQHWQRHITGKEFKAKFVENQILDIRRERRKNGGLLIHLYYPDSEEVISWRFFAIP